MRSILMPMLLAVICAYAPAQNDWDPIADHNATIEAIPASERAWPVYIAAYDALQDLAPDDDTSGVHPDVGIYPGDSEGDWDSLAEWLRNPIARHASAEFRRAAELPHLGMTLTAGDNPVQAKYWAARYPDYEPAGEPDDALMMSMLLPHLGMLRGITRQLCSEGALALAEGNPALFVANIGACVSSSAHAVEPPLLISQILRFAMIAKVCALVQWALSEHPEAIDDRVGPELSTRLASLAANDTYALDTSIENLIFEDLVRRCIDAGGGFDPDRLGMLARVMQSDQKPPPPPPPGSAGALRGQAREAVNAYRLLAAAATRESRKPWDADLATPTQDLERTLETLDRPASLLAGIIKPDWNAAIRSIVYARTTLDATLLTLALHRHHLRHAAWPATLADLDADLLDAPPIDAFTGKPLLYKLTDTGPLVYSAGADRDDDDARPLRDADGAITTPKWIPAASIQPTLESDPASIDGDWILFPPTD